MSSFALTSLPLCLCAFVFHSLLSPVERARSCLLLFFLSVFVPLCFTHSYRPVKESTIVIGELGGAIVLLGKQHESTPPRSLVEPI
ncbi:MAG: hypothetical protein ACRCT1_12800 [Microcoleaceae cyanobacterium]